MAGLLDIFGTSGADTLGLLGMSPADIQRNREDAQAQALYALAGRLFQGGNTGQSIAEGLQAGQLREGYQGQQLGADIARFNFLQNQPQQNLQNYMSLVYGNPLGRVGSTTASGAADTSTLQKLLGTAATASAVYKNLGSPNLGNWLSGWGSGSSITPDMSSYYNTMNQGYGNTGAYGLVW